MKACVIGGAGVVGSTAACRIAAADLVDEIVLIDANENLVNAHAMDMEQAAALTSRTVVRAGTFADLEGCDLAIMSASVHEKDATNRLQYLNANIPIVRLVAEQLAAHCPDAIVINATNPVDVFVYLLRQMSGMLDSQVIGLSANDSVRFRWAIGKVLDVPVRDVQALVIGEHGPAQVLLFSGVTVAGERLDLTPIQRTKIAELVQSWFGSYTGLRSDRSSGWTSAASLAHIVECIVTSRGETVCASVIPHGEYGLADVSIGLPITLNTSGVSSIVQLELAPDEVAALASAAAKVRTTLSQLDVRFDW